jgi:hypothetical protein
MLPSAQHRLLRWFEQFQKRNAKTQMSSEIQSSVQPHASGLPLKLLYEVASANA